MKFRHEIKTEINQCDALVLKNRLKEVMSPDSYSENGKYLVRSLYFDNLEDKALREKTDGVNYREKFRLRIYNNDSSLIKLEKKSKINGLCLKRSEVISKDVAEMLSVGNFEKIEKDASELLWDFSFKSSMYGLIPKTVVDYEREAFVFKAGNTRVTVDSNIRTGIASADFLNHDLLTVPAGESKIILEIKWDEFLPEIIKDITDINGRRSSAFSKYAACRIYF